MLTVAMIKGKKKPMPKKVSAMDEAAPMELFGDEAETEDGSGGAEGATEADPAALAALETVSDEDLMAEVQKRGLSAAGMQSSRFSNDIEDEG